MLNRIYNYMLTWMVTYSPRERYSDIFVLLNVVCWTI